MYDSLIVNRNKKFANNNKIIFPQHHEMICETSELPHHNILTNNNVFFLPLKKQELSSHITYFCDWH